MEIDKEKLIAERLKKFKDFIRKIGMCSDQQARDSLFVWMQGYEVGLDDAIREIESKNNQSKNALNND